MKKCMLITILVTILINACAPKPGEEGRAEYLIEKLRKDIDYSEQREIENELVSIGEGAIPPLIDAFTASEEATDSLSFVKVLEKIASPSTIQPLSDHFNDPTHLEWKDAYIVEILGQVNDEGIVNPLIDIYWHYADDRSEPAEILQAEIIGILLESVDSRIIPIAVHGLGNWQTNMKAYNLASTYIEELGTNAGEHLVNGVEAGNDNLNIAIIEKIARIDDPQIVEWFWQLLSLDDDAITEAVVEQFNLLDLNLSYLSESDNYYSADLIQVYDQMLRHEAPLVRYSALGILRDAGSDPEAMDLLQSHLDSSDQVIRQAAIRMLFDRQASNALTALQTEWDRGEDNDSTLHFYYNHFDDIQIIDEEVIRDALSDNSEFVRANAIFNISRIQSEELLPEVSNLLLDESEFVRYAAVGVIGEFKKEGYLDQALPLADDPSEYVRGAVLDLAAISSDETIIPYLSPFVQDRSEDLRLKAIGALGEIGGSQVVVPLIPAITDVSKVRSKALDVYFSLSDEDLDPLLSQYNMLKEAKEIFDEEQFYNILIADWGDRPNPLSMIARTYPYFIARGEAGSEDILVQTLFIRGDKSMAVHYLNCGNDVLESAAEEWAKENGYTILHLPSSGGSNRWGSGN